MKIVCLNFLLALNFLKLSRFSYKFCDERVSSLIFIHGWSSDPLAEFLSVGFTVNRDVTKAFASFEIFRQYLVLSYPPPSLIFKNRSSCDRATNGRWPTSSVYVITPNDHISTFVPYRCPSRISGATWSGVPH